MAHQYWLVRGHWGVWQSIGVEQVPGRVLVALAWVVVVGACTWAFGAHIEVWVPLVVACMQAWVGA